jgi:hypothetical protein
MLNTGFLYFETVSNKAGITYHTRTWPCTECAIMSVASRRADDTPTES